MIRIQLEQLWDIIYQDKLIQKELRRQLKEFEEKREKCYRIYQEQLEVLKKIDDKKKKEAKEIQELEDSILRCHNQISTIEIKIILIERKIRKLLKEKEKLSVQDKRYLSIVMQIAKEQQKIKDYRKKQDDIYDTIHTKENEIVTKKQHLRDFHENEVEEQKNLHIAKGNVVEWDLAIETKQNHFYQDTFQYLNENHQTLQRVMERNLQQSKKLTKDEAKKKTNAVLIGSDQISIDPPGKVRRLTKEEEEKYQNVDEL